MAYAQLTATSEGVYVSMSQSYTVKEEGYAYMYVSNEDQRLVDVYFDDVAMTYTPSNVVQYNEYYPFGLQTQNSWTRTNTTNNFLYNEASELNNTSSLYDLPFRNYDAALGRFHQIDPLATRSHNATPYEYAGNNPVSYNDPSGLLKALDIAKNVSGPIWALQPGGGGWADTYAGGEGPAAGNPAEGDAKAVKEGRMILADYAAKYGESVRLEVSEGDDYVRQEFTHFLAKSNSVWTLVGILQQEPFGFKDEFLPNSYYTKRGNGVNWATLTNEFLTGDGPERSLFLNDHPIIEDLKKSTIVAQAMLRFLQGGQTPLIREHIEANPFIHVPLAGTNMIEQFIGSARISIIPTSEGFVFILNNTTGRYSGGYDSAEDIPRVTGETTPKGNIYQRFIWIVPF